MSKPEISIKKGTKMKPLQESKVREDGTIVTLKNRRLVFANTKYEVFSDHLVDGNNVEVQDYLVVAPHSSRQDLITGVAVVPIFNGKIVLQRIHRHAVNRTQIEVPRGFVDSDEEPHHAALRELAEELGLKCELLSLIPLGFVTPEASTIAGRTALFAATSCEVSEMQLENELGLGASELLSMEDVQRLIETMELEDVTTVIALRRYFSWANGVAE